MKALIVILTSLFCVVCLAEPNEFFNLQTDMAKQAMDLAKQTQDVTETITSVNKMVTEVRKFVVQCKKTERKNIALKRREQELIKEIEQACTYMRFYSIKLCGQAECDIPLPLACKKR